MPDMAATLDLLRIPLGNRQGQHSIKTDRQWWLYFRWYEDESFDVVITDYHLR